MPLLLYPVLPYDFALSCQVFSKGDPQIRRFQHGIFWQVIRVNGRPMLVQAMDVGEAEEPVLAVNILSGNQIGEEEQKEASKRVFALLSLPDDLDAFFRAVSTDPQMTEISKGFYGLRAPTSGSIFEALVTSVIEQQISVHVARVLESRLVKQFGERLEVAGKTYFAYPEPEDLAGGKIEEFRACGLSARKGEFIRGVAEMVAEGTLDLESLRKLSDSGQVIERLCDIRGIGRWTAEFVLLRGLHRLEIFPADDLGVKRAIARIYCPGHTISADQARAIAERWGDWKGLAAYYLLTAEHIEKQGRIQYSRTRRGIRSV